MARLIVEKGHEKGRSIPLLAKATTVFGRDTSANVQIKDTMASRQHFKIEPRADGPWLVDLQSMNGTLLNGHPAKESKLNPGDLIRVGETMYSFLADDAGDDPLIGQRLGGYKILERVGRGGMGTVYKAEQIDLQRIVALKIISEDHLKNPEFVDLFVHEARAAAKLNHPNIVQVYDVKKANELYYFSMEFVPGGSVQDLLNNKRKIPIAETVRMILDAARGLEYAHRKEIIHRDVKPDNFMLGEGGAIKIGDLGLAQRLGEKLSADNENSVIGTPHYIAPEQVLGKPADTRSDVYSLGSTMYRMIAGFTPFQAPSVRELVNRKAREDAIPLHSALAGIPEKLSQICANMMTRLPEQRTQSMTEVIADLEAWTREEKEGGAAVREPAPHSRKLLVAAVGLLTVVLVGGVIAARVMLKNEKPAVSATDKPAVESGDPESKLDRAVGEENRLEDRKPDEFEAVIQRYDEIATRWPDTHFAKDAARRRDALKARRTSLLAARGLAALDELDREAWKQLVQLFQGGREDLAEAHKRVREFRAFADDPAWKGTEATPQAARRADAISSWIKEVEKRRVAFEKLKAEVDGMTGELRFRDAWEKCNEFISDIAAYPAASKDRYTTLLYDVPARRLQENIVGQASRSLDDAVQKAAALESKGEFAKAVELLQAATRHTLKDPADRAKALGEEINKRWTTANQLAAQRAAEEQVRLATLDRRDFDAAARRWREHVLRFDPKPALAEAQKLGKPAPDRFPRLAAAEARVASRVEHLRLLAEFKELLIRGLNAAPPTLPNRITLDKLPGTIVKASETHLTVAFSQSSHVDHSFGELLAGGAGSAKTAQFLDYLRGAGKNADARWALGLGVLCLELGLYERAAEELKPAEKSPDDATRKLLAELRPMAENLRYPDSDEIEAQKHYERLLLALKDPVSSPRFDIAKTLDILRTRYGETEYFAAQKSRLDEIEKERTDRDARERERTVKAERHRRILAARGRVQAETKARESDITRGLANLKDPIEQRFHYGESQCGFGNLKGSTQALVDALDLGFRKFPPLDRRNYTDPNSILFWVARTGGSLMRNFYLQRQESRAADVRNKIDAKFDDGLEFAPWTAYKAAYDLWAQQAADRLKRHGDKLSLLEKELVENPDAKVLYELAEAHDVLRNAVDARGLYEALMKEFPDFDKVKSGDALLRQAEMTWQLRDAPEAEKLFMRVKAEYPANPRVANPAAYDSVDVRIKQCNELRNKMGLPK